MSPSEIYFTIQTFYLNKSSAMRIAKSKRPQCVPINDNGNSDVILSTIFSIHLWDKHNVTHLWTYITK